MYMLEVAVLLRVVCRNEKENRIYRACSQHGCVLPSGGITVPFENHGRVGIALPLDGLSWLWLAYFSGACSLWGITA